MPKSRDLFDDSTMSFGDHLEALRIHLFKGLIGLILMFIITLIFSDRIIAVIRRPIDIALKERSHVQSAEIAAEENQLEQLGWWDSMKAWFTGSTDGDEEAEKKSAPEEELRPDTIRVKIAKTEIVRVAKEIDPDANINLELKPAADGANSETAAAQPDITILMRSPAFIGFNNAVDAVNKPITLNVQEAFMIYIKVAFVSGLIFSFPWIFYQLWLFVSAGLYDHEKRYVYIFLPVSTVLFFGGAVFCYFGVFPFVLDFLLGFNDWLGVTPQIRLSEWISFALVLPLMFGLSFQLPLVMYFIERMGIVSIQGYRDKRRLAILIIATLSMFLTPADPMSMIMMMCPLILLYELGIIFCKMNPAQNPYEAAA